MQDGYGTWICQRDSGSPLYRLASRNGTWIGRGGRARPPLRQRGRASELEWIVERASCFPFDKLAMGGWIVGSSDLQRRGRGPVNDWEGHLRTGCTVLLSACKRAIPCRLVLASSYDTRSFLTSHAKELEPLLIMDLRAQGRGGHPYVSETHCQSDVLPMKQ